MAFLEAILPYGHVLLGGDYRPSAIAIGVLRNHLSQLVRLIAEIEGYNDVPERYKSRLSVSTDSVAGRKFVDMRVILTVRLLLLSPNATVHEWVVAWRRRTLDSKISDYDQLLLRRLIVSRKRHAV